MHRAMRWLCLLAMWSGCGLIGYDHENSSQLLLVVDTNGLAVDRIEVFGAESSRRRYGLGPMTPELIAAGASQPMAELWTGHRSYGYVDAPPDTVTYPFPDVDGGMLETMMIAV